MKKLQILIIAFLISLSICAFASMHAKAQDTVDHFGFNDISSPQTAGTSFSVTITALDSSGNTVTSYSGTPTLTYSAGSISPSSATGGFSGGVWTGSVTVTVAGAGVIISATDGSYTGTSNSFTVNPTISASAGANGAISPTGSVAVNYGSSQTFAITPDTGYYIASLTVDGSSVAVASSYTFSNVQAAHTITASFAINTPTPTSTLTPTPPLTATPTPAVTLAPTPSQTPALAAMGQYLPVIAAAIILGAVIIGLVVHRRRPAKIIILS
jgi:hypothetical protein